MKSRRLTFGVLSLVVCFVLLAVVVPAQARDTTPSIPAAGDELASGKVLATVGIRPQGGQMTNVVLYDQEWGLVSQAGGTGSAFQFKDVSPGAYHLVAYNDELELWAEKDIDVEAGQTLEVALFLKRAAAKSAEITLTAIAPEPAVAKTSAGSACSGVSGDGKNLKIYPVFGQTIVYMSCGKVVAKIEGGGCGCGASGGWHYTYDCQKSETIYVNLPCWRR
jgi:hypothetical protein